MHQYCNNYVQYGNGYGKDQIHDALLFNVYKSCVRENKNSCNQSICSQTDLEYYILISVTNTYINVACSQKTSSLPYLVLSDFPN